MEEKRTVFDYLGSVFFIFGITMVILAVIMTLFGEHAREISSMFSLGADGVPVETIGQFLAVSFLVQFYRELFFTDRWIKRLSVPLRTAAMLLMVVGTIAVFVFLFGWFPVGMWEAWAMFLLFFSFCFLMSVGITSWKMRLDNRKMETGLEKMKEQWREENEKRGE